MTTFGLLEREYQAVTESGGEWYGMTGKHIVDGVDGKTANVRQSLGEMTQAGTLKYKIEGHHHHKTAPTFYWLPTQSRAEYQAPKKGRSRDGGDGGDGGDGAPASTLQSDTTTMASYLLEPCRKTGDRS